MWRSCCIRRIEWIGRSRFGMNFLKGGRGWMGKGEGGKFGRDREEGWGWGDLEK